jgi:hypothetical protein
MSISHKSSNAQLFRLMLYRRALHPELFDLQGRKCHRHGDYEVESWLTPAGHVLRFQVEGQCLTETVLENADHLPEHGLVHALPCLGEKDFELEPDGRIGYVTTIQTESLTDNLFMATLRELREHALESESMVHEFKDSDGSVSLSLLDIQKYKREFHFQSYHLVGSSGLVLRTQSIFEVL